MLMSQVYATFEPQSQPHRRATSGDMLKALDDKQDGKDIIILDARGLEQYTGEASCLLSCTTMSSWLPLHMPCCLMLIFMKVALHHCVQKVLLNC